MKKLFRSCVMRVAYLAQDDPSIARVARSVRLQMNSPSEADLLKLQRIGKYFVKYSARPQDCRRNVFLLRVNWRSTQHNCGPEVNVVHSVT